MKWAELAGKPVVIWGLGKEGLAVLDHLIDKASSLILIDEDADRREQAANMANSRGFFELIAVNAADAPENIPSHAVVVKSPGISRYGELATSLVSSQIPITSSTDLWLSERNGERVIGVTGSKGKSTTTSLIAHLLRAHDVDVSVGGNIGVPLIELSADTSHWCVVEVSSFQASDVTVSPKIGVLTSLFEEHLDWHISYENYVADKLNLFAHGCPIVIVDGANREAINQTEHLPNRSIVNAEGSIARHDGTNVFFKDHLVGTLDDLPIAGGHNLSNVVLAISAVNAAIPDQFDYKRISNALLTFEPLPHRMQKLGMLGKAIVIDDGLATVPPASAAAISMFAQQPAAFFLGGYDRGVSYETIGAAVAGRQQKTYAYLMGPSGEKIAGEYAKLPPNPLVELIKIENMIEGIDHATAHADELEAIVLSPGGASFNEFTDYKERSDVFRAEMLARGMEPQPK